MSKFVNTQFFQQVLQLMHARPYLTVKDAIIAANLILNSSNEPKEVTTQEQMGEGWADVTEQAKKEFEELEPKT